MRSLIFALLLIASQARAQSDFEPINGQGPAGLGQLLIAADTIFSVGFNDLEISADQGATWSREPLDSRTMTQTFITEQGEIYSEGYQAIYHLNKSNWTWQLLDSVPYGMARLEHVSSKLLVARGPGSFYLSRDAGKTWQDTSMIIYYSVSPTGVHFNSYIGWWRSLDDGKTWSEVDIRSSAIHFGKGNTVFNFLGDSVRVSTDAGTSWTIHWSPVGGDYLKLIVDSAGSIYCFGSDTIFRSPDNAKTWSAIPGYAHGAATDRKGGVYVADRGLFYSLQSDKLVPLHANIASKNATSLQRDASGKLWAAFSDRPYEDYGLARSTDNGRSWKPVHSFRSLMNKLCIHNDRMIAAIGGWGDTVRPKGLYISDDEGVNWQMTHDLGNNPDLKVLSLVAVDEVLFATNTLQAGLLRSDDNGLTWTNVTTGFAGRHVGPPVKDRAGNLIAAGGDRLFISADKGLTWTLMNDPVEAANVLAIDSSDRLFLGAYNGLYFSDDREKWSKVLLPVIDWRVLLLLFDPSNVLYASNGSTQMIAYSSDRGSNWTQLHGFGETHYQLNDLVTDRDGYAYALVAGLGIYRTRASGTGAVKAVSVQRDTPDITIIGSSFVLSNVPASTPMEITLTDICGREVLTCSGSREQLTAILDRSNLHGWVGYTLTIQGRQYRGTVMSTR